MIIIRCGITRTVILTKRYAIKIPTGRGTCIGRGFRQRLSGVAQGILANQSEFTWYTYESFQGKVAPVLRSWLGGIIQVYPRCEPLPPSYESWSWPDPLITLDPDPGDHKIDNYGILDGRIVMIDYNVDRW